MNANMITAERIESLILAEQYYVFPGTTVTVCCLTIKNGFSIIGESGCVDPDNFDSDVGQKIARDNAFNKMWELEGYVLKWAMKTVSDEEEIILTEDQ